MTRLLRPPRHITVNCRQGDPAVVYRPRRQVVTHIVAQWVRPAPWWSDEAMADPLNGERSYYRLVLDGLLVVEVFAIDRTEGDEGQGRDWYLSRIID